MFNRRKFLQSSVGGSLAMMLGKKSVAGESSFGEPSIPHITGNPVVISTWDFDKAANTEAWKILGSGGSALDAVEAPVKIPAPDLDTHTVDYAAEPSRHRRPTLDA